MKKGFTLVELLGVLVIISLVSLIVTPKVSELFHKKQLEASEAFKETIFLATRQYITNNEYEFNRGASFYCVTVGNLVESGELVDPVIDVTTGNKIDYETNVEIVVDENNNYNLTYNTEKCNQDDITAPIIAVQRSISLDKTHVTLTISGIDDSPLADLPYSFDNGTTWQLSNELVVTDSFNSTLKVKDKYNNVASVDYSISKLTIDARGGIWNSLTDVSVFWLEKDERMTIANPLKLGNTFNGWEIDNEESIIEGTSFKMGNANTRISARWTLTQYTLTVNPNGGTWSGSTSQVLTLNQTVIIENPTKSGCVFGGWTVTGTGSTLNDVTFTIGSSDARLDAIWYTFATMYTYTGVSTVIDDGGGNWRIKFLTSGNLTFFINVKFDVFLVGGGSSLGGSGYTATYTTLSLTKNIVYPIVVGDGGAVGSNGTASTAFGKTANPGNGGNGGSGAGYSGYTDNGGNGGSDGASAGGGTGQGTTTREFGESTGALYAGGGGGGCGWLVTVDSKGNKTYYDFYGGVGGAVGGGNGASDFGSMSGGTPNTGGGAGLGVRGVAANAGGSGIVIMRNTRVPDIYTYTGNSLAINDGNGNWRIKFFTSGTFTPKINMNVDIFLIGGGGGGANCVTWAGGGGSGYTSTISSIALTANTAYTVTIGAGGSTSRGGTTLFASYSALGGFSNDGQNGGAGGSGGGAGGTDTWSCGATNGASNGANADSNCAGGGLGQGTTTREFGETMGTLYAGGGGGWGYAWSGTGGAGGGGGSGSAGTPNTGGGGGACANGGTGVAIIRNHR